MNTSPKKGFTLIELLIVIGILAILATLTILVLNPAQLFAQARDSQRLGDLRTLQSAITYAATTSSSTPTFLVGPYSSAGAVTCGFGTCVAAATVGAVNGTGWVGVDMTSATGGAPLSRLPLDPVNTATYNYSYKGDNTNKTFELDVVLESAKYIPQMSSDGGNSASFYEAGTDPSLDL